MAGNRVGRPEPALPRKSGEARSRTHAGAGGGSQNPSALLQRGGSVGEGRSMAEWFMALWGSRSLQSTFRKDEISRNFEVPIARGLSHLHGKRWSQRSSDIADSPEIVKVMVAGACCSLIPVVVGQRQSWLAAREACGDVEKLLYVLNTKQRERKP